MLLLLLALLPPAVVATETPLASLVEKSPPECDHMTVLVSANERPMRLHQSSYVSFVRNAAIIRQIGGNSFALSSSIVESPPSSLSLRSRPPSSLRHKRRSRTRSSGRCRTWLYNKSLPITTSTALQSKGSRSSIVLDTFAESPPSSLPERISQSNTPTSHVVTQCSRPRALLASTPSRSASPLSLVEKPFAATLMRKLCDTAKVSVQCTSMVVVATRLPRVAAAKIINVVISFVRYSVTQYIETKTHVFPLQTRPPPWPVRCHTTLCQSPAQRRRSAGLCRCRCRRCAPPSSAS